MLLHLLALPAVAAALNFAPYTITLSDGRTVAAEMAHLTVSERRADPKSRSIELGVIRLRGTGPANTTPIVFLPGSPDGASGSETIGVASLYPFFEQLRTKGDVIILDYRGSGLSRPAISCPADPYRTGTFTNRDSALASIVGSARRCAATLREDGFDIGGYTWAEVADDIADLRTALGVPQISIVGFSSGTHAALAFVRHHDREVSRLVLAGTEGPDNTRKLPGNIDRQIEKIAALVHADSMVSASIPDFGKLIRQTIDSLDRTPAIVTVTRGRGGETLREPVGGLALAYLTSKSISGPEDFTMLPALYHRIAHGDVTLLARIIQRLVNSSGNTGRRYLSYMLDGSSGVSPARAARIALESKTSLLGDAVNFPFPDIEKAWGSIDSGPRFREPIESNVQTLFVTGTLDGNTPPNQAEEIRAGFRNSRRLTIRNGGHGSAFTTPAAWPVISAFLAGKTVKNETVDAPPVRFLPLVNSPR
jgi:pimeloyl-ACP methyl ester carboxylesterase